jgi:hypothetical protein
MASTELSPRADAPQTTIVTGEREDSSILPYAVAAAAGIGLLYWSGILGAAKSVSEGAGKIVTSVADVVADAANFLSYAFTWPDKLKYPQRERAKWMYTEMFPQLIEACKSGAFAEACLYLGYSERYAVLRKPQDGIDNGFWSGNYIEDLGHVIPRSQFQKDRYPSYMPTDSWKQSAFVSVHMTENVILCNGHLFAVDPELSFVLDIVRYGQTQDGGFSVWPDGSDGNPREGYVEGWLMCALLRSLMPGVPLGFTQGVVLAANYTYFIQGGQNGCSAPSGSSYSVSFLGDGFPLKVLWPYALNGFTYNASYAPHTCDTAGDPACCIGWYTDNQGREYVSTDCRMPDSLVFWLTIAPYGKDALPGDCRDMRQVDLAIQIDGRTNMEEKPVLDVVNSLVDIQPDLNRYLVFPASPPDWYNRLASLFGTAAQRDQALQQQE